MSALPAPAPVTYDPAQAVPVPARTHADRTRALLAAHVPLSLLLDLADPAGPHSQELLSGEPGSADWLVRAR